MKNILVIGAGIVGICTGIELIKKGYFVTLLDPNEPGSVSYTHLTLPTIVDV